MPGLVGLITRMPEPQARQQLAQMVQAIHHEPFYLSGTWADVSMGVYLGWVARQGSFSETMPLTNERGDVTLVFSGEDHREPGAAQELRQRGHTLPLNGPQYLVHLYEEDPAFFAGLNGMFQGVVVDHNRGTATLFNDRYGMHRVYFHESKDAFYFAVEAKAILTVCPESRILNPLSLGECVSFGCVVNNRSIFQHIHVVPPAAAWEFTNGRLAMRRTYFDPTEWEDLSPLDPESYYTEFKSTFARILPRYVNGPEPVAMALTGGLDTRVIMAWMKAPPGSLPCFTFSGSLRESYDVTIARKVAAVCKQSHELISVGEKFLSRFRDYAERTIYLSEGCLTVANSPDLYISERAREIAPAKVVGTWGSEILTRAITFKPNRSATDVFHPDFLDYVNRAEETYASLRRLHPLTFAAFHQTQWSHYGIEALELSQVGIRAPFLDNDVVRAVYRAPLINPTDVRVRLIHDVNPALARVPSDRGVCQPGVWNAMSLLRLVREFSFKAEYAYDYGMPPWLARADHHLSFLRLHRLFLGRHKFLHFRLWYRGRLSEYVRQILLDPLTLSRPQIRRSRVEEIVNEHVNGKRNHTAAIHNLLTLELLQRQFL